MGRREVPRVGQEGSMVVSRGFTSLVLSCKQLSSANKLGWEKKSQQPLCLAQLSSVAMVPAVGTEGGGPGSAGSSLAAQRCCSEQAARTHAGAALSSWQGSRCLCMSPEQRPGGAELSSSSGSLSQG